METNEFRIGNLLHDREGRLCKVEKLDINEEEFENTNYKIDAPAIIGGITGLPNKPIPLDEAWIFKLSCTDGIVHKLKPGVFKLDRFRLIWRNEYKFWYVLDAESLAYITKVEFVHEWQNIYFALNGEELK